jgi:hypothetical protein
MSRVASLYDSMIHEVGRRQVAPQRYSTYLSNSLIFQIDVLTLAARFFSLLDVNFHTSGNSALEWAEGNQNEVIMLPFKLGLLLDISIAEQYSE